MPSAAFLSALNLVRNATAEQLRVLLNPRELELALHGIGISTTDLDLDELAAIKDEINMGARLV